MGKPADQSVGFVYPSGGGNDIGVYKQPQMNNESADISWGKNPNALKGIEVGPETPAMNVSVGDSGANRVEKEGITMRGYGAATKGIKSRGPMA